MTPKTDPVSFFDMGERYATYSMTLGGNTANVCREVELTESPTSDLLQSPLQIPVVVGTLDRLTAAVRMTMKIEGKGATRWCSCL